MLPAVVQKALEHKIVAIDTETNGLSWTSRPVGVSAAAPGAPGEYWAWGHQGGGNLHMWPQVEDFLTALDVPGMTVVMHNAQFDMRMLAYMGFRFQHATVTDTGLVAALLFEYEPSFSLGALGKKYLQRQKSDTALNEYCAQHFGGPATRRAQAKNYWRVPVPIIAEYAIDDAQLTLDLFHRRFPKLQEEGLLDIYALEVAQFPVLLDMHMEGVRVDTAKADEVRNQLEADYFEVRQRWNEYSTDVNINSSPQLQSLFDSYHIPYPRTKKGNPSFAAPYLKTIREDYPLVGLLLDMRRLGTLTGTFIKSYIEGQTQFDGRIHCNFNSFISTYGGTVSGRYSSSEPNLQNIPARDEIWAPIIRGLFIPTEDGWRWVKSDYSQIEYRLFAHYAGGAVLDAYQHDPDIDFHQMVADLTGHPRSHAKNINFASLYGAGVVKIAAMCGVSEDEAYEILNDYHTRLPEVHALSQNVVNTARRRGWIFSMGGRRHRFPARLQSKNRHAQAWKALNRLCQGSAADLIKAAMVKIHQNLDPSVARMHLTVHDELDFSVAPGAEGDRQIAMIKECMEEVAPRALMHGPPKVPIRAEIEIGPDWGHVA